MDLKLIDQALDVAIAGLLYGTEAWFVCAFSLHVASRWKEYRKDNEVSTVKLLAVQESPDSPLVAPPCIVIRPPTAPTIRCEPVNWKQWKVSDLRKASIAKACGVRTRPIGSQRNLLKADLIAQYEQNLKRVTSTAATVSLKRSISSF